MADSLRIGIVAGEASGDLLGARVLEALRERCDSLVVEGIGGPLMQAQGLVSLSPMEPLSVMGLFEPLRRLPELLSIRRRLCRHFSDNPPDIFLGIDAPDFNLHLEARLRSSGIGTAHLVSPSVWAWRRGRIHKIGRAVDRMLCLFPFETDIYRRHGIAEQFVGHPLADEIAWRTPQATARQALGLPSEGKVIALLPGSRAAEVTALAPLFLQVAEALWQQNRALTFVLPAANPQRFTELERHLEAYPHLHVELIEGRSREAMAAADAVLLAAGTATLEAALLRRPMVVAYRTGALSWYLLSALVRTPYIALPNLLARRELVPEFLQSAATLQALASALESQLDEGELQGASMAAYDDLHRSLQRGCAGQVAEALLQLAHQKRSVA